MDDMASVGLQVDSRPVRKASGDLDKFGKEAKKAGGAATKLGKSSKAAFGAMAAGAASAAAAVLSLGTATRQALEFGSALSEVGTLIEGTAKQTAFLDDASKRLAATYGGTGTAQAKAFYQAISAGAGSVEEAAETLDAANRLAIGGVTDVTTAVGILSTAMNVYEASNLSAAEASDAIFVAVKAGVTTVGELSSALGKVLPLAEEMGLTFDETAAATAALTKGGLSTAEAVTGLRASLAAVLGPTTQAADMAKEIGLDFSAAAIEAQGFAGFMADVVAKTDGSAEKMQTLFGSVEAVGAALAFSGSAGESMAAILDDMAVKTGATSEAFNKMSEDMQQRLNVVMGEVWGLTTSFGSALLTVLVPALEGAAGAMTLLADNVDMLAVAVIGLVSTAIPGAITGLVAMTGGMSAAAIATGVFTGAVSAARLALTILGGPLGIVFGLIGAAAGAFFLFRDNAGEMETASYDAESGSLALAEALDKVTAAEPGSSAAVIALANNNVKLADSAFDAASAELAKRRAMLDEAEAVAGGGRSRRGAILRNERLVREALERQVAAEVALATAIRDRKLASEEIAVTKPDQPSHGAGGGSSAASKIDQEREAIDRVVDSLKDQIAAIGETSTARKTAQALRQAGVSLYSKEGQQIADLVEQYAEMQEAQRINEDISRSLKDAILDFALEGTDALDGMTKAFQRMAIEAALFGEGMMGNGEGGLIGGLVDSASGALSGLLGGSASAGPLAGQPIFDIASSFDGGGYTGSGARTGGLDGRGGFMAMMHPRERVYDESRGQSRGQQGGVVNNIKVIAPPGSEVSEERQQNSSGGEDLTVMIDRAVSSLARDPSSAISRTLGNSYGVGRQTRKR